MHILVGIIQLFFSCIIPFVQVFQLRARIIAGFYFFLNLVNSRLRGHRHAYNVDQFIDIPADIRAEHFPCFGIDLHLLAACDIVIDRLCFPIALFIKIFIYDIVALRHVPGAVEVIFRTQLSLFKAFFIIFKGKRYSFFIKYFCHFASENQLTIFLIKYNFIVLHVVIVFS